MKPFDNIRNSRPVRLTLCAFIFVAAGAALYGLGTLLAAQIYCRKAEASYTDGHFGLAANYLARAAALNPGNAAIKKRRGDICFQLAGLQGGKVETNRMNKKAYAFYQAAQRLNTIDADTAYSLARVADRLETQPAAAAENSPGQALPYYQRALRLRPNGVSYRYAQLRYFAGKELAAELTTGVQTLCRIYPRSFHYLKKEPFWSADLETAAASGLQAAVTAGIDPRNAHMALSAVNAGEQNWAAAAAAYQQALAERTFTNRPGEYAHLSTLYLQSGDRTEAGHLFQKAIRHSRDREKDLTVLYHRYRQGGFLKAYIEFYQATRRRLVMPARADILEARALIELKRYTRARTVLEAVNRRVPEADAYYWLAKIAQADRQWDAMELAAQKATVYDPTSSSNHHLFAVSLQKQKKYPGAEKQADLALMYAPKPNPWMFNQRAWIRWARKNYIGAVRDWKRAARLKPEYPGFYAQIGEGYQKLGDNSRAVQSYVRAVKLAPENERYRKRLSQLDKLAAVSG